MQTALKAKFLFRVTCKKSGSPNSMPAYLEPGLKVNTSINKWFKFNLHSLLCQRIRPANKEDIQFYFLIDRYHVPFKLFKVFISQNKKGQLKTKTLNKFIDN